MKQQENREKAPENPASSDDGLAAIAAAVLEALPASAAVLDAAGVIVAVNEGWRHFAAECGFPDGTHGIGARYGEGLVEAADCLSDVIDGRRDSHSFIHACRTGDGQRWFRAHFATLHAGGARGVIVMHFDISDSVSAEQRLFQLAHYDSLTGLPNRLYTLDRLQHMLVHGERYERRLAVLLIDLDRFKMVNDTLGHAAGDDLLRQVVRRVGPHLRASDIFGRIGSDEFAVIVPDLGTGQEPANVARKLVDTLVAPFRIGEQDVFIGASIGIAVFPDDARDAETLLRYADTAMFRAKEAGRGSWCFHTPQMNERALERLRLETDLRQALERGEFELHYQPKVSCASGEIVGLEALLRWNHPQRGLVLPAEFVPVLEETGLIVPVGGWALATACRQLASWRQAGCGRVSVAVNLAARQLEDPGLIDTVHRALADSKLEAGGLELELTESVLMRNAEHVIATLGELRRLGVRFSVDDFGTGYSSLAYLKRFPLDALKVDRSFVQDIAADPDDASITRAVITMAHQLKLKVVAEGVETNAQLTLLIANQCDEIQGYLFSKPLPAAAAGTLLQSRSCLSEEQLRAAQRKRTLLLVDDEENILSALRRLLRRDGYEILTANGGQRGLELLAENAVDVIVSDQRMPNMTGVEFLRRVKTIHPETVRIVLSGYTELQSITDAINEGAIYKFLTKPWDDEQLRSNIEEAFRHKELADDNRRLSHDVQVANQELAHANQQLRAMVDEKQRQIVRDEATLDVAQEILQHVPMPIVGFDDETMIVFANLAAEALLGEGSPLLGSYAGERLPAALQPLLSETAGESCVLWPVNGRCWQVSCCVMGERSRSRGRLMLFVAQAILEGNGDAA